MLLFKKYELTPAMVEALDWKAKGFTIREVAEKIGRSYLATRKLIGDAQTRLNQTKRLQSI